MSCLKNLGCLAAIGIGLNSIVINDVSIGNSSIVVADRILVKNVQENVVLSNNPALVVKKLERNV
jgi:maltose O-acetyltransferase